MDMTQTPNAQLAMMMVFALMSMLSLMQARNDRSYPPEVDEASNFAPSEREGTDLYQPSSKLSVRRASSSSSCPSSARKSYRKVSKSPVSRKLR